MPKKAPKNSRNSIGIPNTRAPCLPQGPSVFPSTSVCPPVALSVCVEVLSEYRNPPMPVSKGIYTI